MTDLGIESWFGSYEEFIVSFDPKQWKINKVDEQNGEVEFITTGEECD